MEPHHRPSRLEKQEEIDEEEESFMLSPVTIQIEDRGGNPGDEDQDDKNKDSPYTFDDDDSSSRSGKASNPDLSPDTMDMVPEYKPQRRRSSGRVKLLVRSHAVHDDASPPPDLETIITNTNMLSVTNASSFSIQSQSKGATNKIRLGNQSSSQGSTESSSASGLSRDSSTETYTDSSGIDLQQFIVDTLHKNQKDRLMLLKVEQELIQLIKDNKRQSMKFPQMSSYNRMLVHRVAAYFGLDHYVDGNGTSVIVNKTKTARMPDSRFQDFIRDELLPEEPKKSILKRDSISFEEGKEQKSPERQSSTDSRRSKSFEEREEEYEKARARIFNQDEGFGEPHFNRSQEGTHCSSHRSSQEDVRWPSSETRPWSSTDSDSSGRPLGSKLSSSFETDAPAQKSKVSRSFGASTKSEVENKVSSAPTKASRPVMTKASSFGGISVLSRESSSGKSVTPRITKAESFNVTTISSSPVSSLNDGPNETEEESSETVTELVSSSTITLQTVTCQFSTVIISTEQTFPVIAGQPSEIQVSYMQDSSQQTTNWQPVAKELSNDYTSSSVVGQPLTWPYSTGTDILFPGVFLNPQTGYPRVAISACQSLTVSTADQVSTTIGQSPSGTIPSSSNSSSLRPQPSTLQSQIQQPQATINTSSPTVFYVPYISQVPSSVSHQSSLTPVQSIRHQAQSSHFISEPRPLVLFPVCYLQQTSNVHPVRHTFSSTTSQPNAQCQSQSTSLHVANIAEVKSHASTGTTHLLSPQYLPCFPALSCTQSVETSLVITTSTTVYPYSNINVGTTGNACHTSLKSPFTSQPSQPSVCIQQSFMQVQTASVTLPPVYVSITSSTQSPATRTHAGGHVAAQFSSSRSQSLPVSSSSGMLNHSVNSGTPFLGYTVYAPPIQGLPATSPLTTVAISQNNPAQPSQFNPAYVSAFQVLPPNVPLVANIGSNSSPLSNVLRSQYAAPISTISKMPLSFPLVKQTSDPGIGEHVTVASAVPNIFEWIRFRGTSCINDLCLVGPPLQQHLRPLLLPQQPSITRFPRASISHHSPANRPPKTRKHRSKGSSASSALHAPQSIFDGEGKRILKVEGLPEDLKRCDVEHYLELVTDMGAKVYFLNSESLKIIDDSSDFIVSSNKHLVFAVFDNDTAAQNALLNINTTKFQLRNWYRSQDSQNVKRS